MNITRKGAESMAGFAVLVILAGLASAIFWMVVGWRAMRAHERIAEAAEAATRANRAGGAARSSEGD